VSLLQLFSFYLPQLLGDETNQCQSSVDVDTKQNKLTAVCFCNYSDAINGEAGVPWPMADGFDVLNTIV